MRRPSSFKTIFLSILTPSNRLRFSWHLLERYGMTSSTGPKGTYFNNLLILIPFLIRNLPYKQDSQKGQEGKWHDHTSPTVVQKTLFHRFEGCKASPSEKSHTKYKPYFNSYWVIRDDCTTFLRVKNRIFLLTVKGTRWYCSNLDGVHIVGCNHYVSVAMGLDVFQSNVHCSMVASWRCIVVRLTNTF